MLARLLFSTVCAFMLVGAHVSANHAGMESTPAPQVEQQSIASWLSQTARDLRRIQSSLETLSSLASDRGYATRGSRSWDYDDLARHSQEAADYLRRAYREVDDAWSSALSLGL